ncbi:hypothetical protein [Actinophytocola sp.]|uniref:hypothetical protein n=1 Tax=Actinophytocola sp. TaxID=1872138 RepID=UPI003D6C411B
MSGALVLGRVGVVPYIATWSAEDSPAIPIIEHPGRGIAYPDETLTDRDQRGVLWTRTTSRPGEGRPEFGKVHPLRQRRAMRRLLCQVCATPADHDARGVFWLLNDHPEDWPNWPDAVVTTHPPTCLACARMAVRLCPALRRSHTAVRVGRSTVCGVFGTRYRADYLYAKPSGPESFVPYEDPTIRWTCAGQLVRELTDCTVTDLPGDAP